MDFYGGIGKKHVFQAFSLFEGRRAGGARWGREELQRKPLPGSACRWKNVARWWGTATNGGQMEIDVVAESPDGRTLLVGEAKLAMPEAEAARRLAELEAKAKRLPFAGRYKQIEARLFVSQEAPAGAISLRWCETGIPLAPGNDVGREQSSSGERQHDI